MNEEQYRELCETCDQVLKSTDSTFETKCISWLHIIREHPIFLRDYECIYERKHLILKNISLSIFDLRNKLSWIKSFLLSLMQSYNNAYIIRTVHAQFDIIIVSHLLNKEGLRQDYDFYFGSLPGELYSNNINVLMVYINHTGERIYNNKLVESNRKIPYIVLPDNLKFFDEVNIFRRLNKESKRLLSKSKNEKNKKLCQILKLASKYTLNGKSHTSLRRSIQLAAVIKKYKPTSIMLTYEGHGWERTAFYAAREANPNIYCIGYQHAALFRLQHGIQRDLGNKFDPDHILTAGLVSENQLKNMSSLHGKKITVLGSNKIVDNYRYEKSKKYLETFDGVCLVLPEGILSECEMLFKFSLECAKYLPEVEFVWRLHPIMNFNSLVKKERVFADLPKNVKLSDNSFDEDLTNCRWVLYRGSTAVLNALQAGARPIYYQRENEMTIDPLYELNDWKVVVSKAAQFVKVVKSDQGRDKDMSISGKEEAKKYAKRFYVPFDIGKIENLIRF